MSDNDNLTAKLDHAKREIVAARFFEIPAEAITAIGNREWEVRDGN